MKNAIIALCVVLVAGCQHAPEVRFSTYDPCFVYPVGTEFGVYCSWNSGKSDFDMKKCIESAGLPVTKIVPPGEAAGTTYDTAIGPADSGEAIRRANALRQCISKDM